MADWTFVPDADAYTVEASAPPTLISRYEDGTEDRRQKHSNFPQNFREKHTVDSSDMETMLDFFDARGMLTTFTKVSYLPHEAALHEVTVRFASPIRFVDVGPDEWETTIEFEKVF